MKRLYTHLLVVVLVMLCGYAKAQTVQYVTTAPPLTGGNSQAGITFNVKAINAITVKEVHCVFASSTSYSVTVWYHPTDSISGTPTVSTANGWIALGPYSVTATAGVVTPVVTNLSLSFNANTVHGFHISVASGSVTYTTGSSSIPTVFGDANMYVNTGNNVGYGGSPPNSSFHVRQFNGKIGYVLSGPPCNAPTGLTASSITNTTANLSWGAVTGSQGYEYVLSTSATPPTGAGTSTSATSYSASGLTPNTTYYMHVRNVCGSSAFSSWTTTSFTTLNFVSCYPPTTASITNMTVTEATLSWAPVSGSQGYEYIINQSPGSPAGNGTATSVTSAQLTGLTGGATYYAHIRNVCQPTDKSAWLSQSFTMPTCDKPVSVLISNITDSTTDLMWSQMPNASGYDYAVDFSSLPPTTGISHTPGISVHLTSLIPNSKYYVHVRSHCFMSDVSDWRLDSFVTLMVCYAPIVQVNHLGTSNPYAYWDPVPTAIAYEYAVTNAAQSPAFGTTIYTPYVGITLDEDDKDYYLHVRTKCNSMFTFSQWSVVQLRKSTTGIPGTVTGEPVSLYPNPVTNMLYVSGAREGALYEITDMTGRVHLSGTISPHRTEISTGHLPSAVYMLRIIDGGVSGIHRFIRQ